MAWRDKAVEIAEKIIDKAEKTGRVQLLTRQDMVEMLASAAIDGMAYECDIAVMPLLNKMNNQKSE